MTNLLTILIIICVSYIVLNCISFDDLNLFYEMTIMTLYDLIWPSLFTPLNLNYLLTMKIFLKETAFCFKLSPLTDKTLNIL